jgi:hypothetical protein
MSTLDQLNEKVHRPSLQFHRTAVAAQLVGSDVELERTKPKRLERIGRGHRG